MSRFSPWSRSSPAATRCVRPSLFSLNPFSLRKLDGDIPFRKTIPTKSVAFVTPVTNRFSRSSNSENDFHLHICREDGPAKAGPRFSHRNNGEDRLEKRKMLCAFRLPSRIFPMFLLVAIFALSSSSLFAGDVLRLSGVVTDQTGAVIAQAKLSVDNGGTGLRKTVETDSQGWYELLLPAGHLQDRGNGSKASVYSRATPSCWVQLLPCAQM